MGRYAEWADHEAMFPGAMSEEEFLLAIGEAEAYIDVMTGGRAACAQGYALERLKIAVCALAEQIARERRAEEKRRMAEEANRIALEKNAAGEMQIEQVSIDGYSEKYHIGDALESAGRTNAVAMQENEAAMKARRAVVREWLSGTGLVSAL